MGEFPAVYLIVSDIDEYLNVWQKGSFSCCPYIRTACIDTSVQSRLMAHVFSSPAGNEYVYASSYLLVLAISIN